MRHPFARVACWLAMLPLATTSLPALGQGYAGIQPPPPPIAEDGTIQWGIFYKSAAMQKAYERLWKLGACRGTNKAITVPVENNKVQIDLLPETTFDGIVTGCSGTVAGGMIAFVEAGPARHDEPLYVAQLHPAGVSALSVTGPASAAIIAPGMIVRLQGMVDTAGKGIDRVETIEIITPPDDFEPPVVEPETRGEIVGTVVSCRNGSLSLKIAAGRIRRVILSLSEDVVVRFDAAQLEYVAPGDHIRLTGRLWTGEGAMASGTIFASEVAVTKKL